MKQILKLLSLSILGVVLLYCLVRVAIYFAVFWEDLLLITVILIPFILSFITIRFLKKKRLKNSQTRFER